MPQEFLCPITLEIMIDPVIASDEHTCKCPRLVMFLLVSGRAISPLSSSVHHLTKPDKLLGLLQMSAWPCCSGCKNTTQVQSRDSPSNLTSGGILHCDS